MDREYRMCLQCDAEFDTGRPTQKFCCDDCRKEYHRLKGIEERSLVGVVHTCKYCNEQFTPTRRGHEFCSSTCYFKDRHVPADNGTRQCEWCQKEFSGRSNKIYCSKSCGDKAHRKKTNPHWDVGVYSIGGPKYCASCGAMFKITSNGSKYCSKCSKDRYKAYYIDIQQEKMLKRKYNMTIEDYNELFTKQEGCCNICGIHQSELNKRLFIDHDHTSGKVRGLLCSKCNSGLGMFNDDITALRNAIKYLGGDD